MHASLYVGEVVDVDIYACRALERYKTARFDARNQRSARHVRAEAAHYVVESRGLLVGKLSFLGVEVGRKHVCERKRSFFAERRKDFGNRFGARRLDHAVGNNVLAVGGRLFDNPIAVHIYGNRRARERALHAGHGKHLAQHFCSSLACVEVVAERV